MKLVKHTVALPTLGSRVCQSTYSSLVLEHRNDFLQRRKGSAGIRLDHRIEVLGTAQSVSAEMMSLRCFLDRLGILK